MSVLDSLKNSPKGQLTYNRKLEPFELKHVLDQVSPVPLSRHHQERESSKFNLSFGLDASSFEEANDSNCLNDFNENYNHSDSDSRTNDVINKKRLSLSPGSIYHSEKRDSSKDEIVNPGLSPPKNINRSSMQENTSLAAQTLFGLSSCAIKDEEMKWQEVFNLSLMKRDLEFEAHDRALTALMKQKETEMKWKLDRQATTRQTLIDRKLQEGAEETQKLLQRLKEDREEHHMKIATKNKEIEQQRMKLEEEEKARQAVKIAKIEKLCSVFKQVDENRLKFSQLQDTYAHKDHLSEIIVKFRVVLETVCSKLAAQVQSAETTGVSVDNLIQAFEEHKLKSQQAVDYLKKEIAEVDARFKQDEEKKKQDEVKKAEETQQKEEIKKLENQAAEDCRVQALTYVVREFEAKKQKLAEVETCLQPFINNAQMKKYRFDLQRAVNMPINAISALSGSHLRDKLQRLHDLLSGKPVDVSGKRVVATDAPEAILFCQNLVAKMLVKKGEEQVTSKHDSAFAISAIVVGLWAEFPLIGDLFLAHLQALCPYVLPFYAVSQEGQSSVDYHRELGYKVSEDGNIEEQDKFLRRMSGLMRLYCACLVSLPLKGPSSPHPQGLEYAWMWLSRTLNIDPYPDVTAAMLHDVLFVTGHALVTEYRVQFVKLIQVIQKQYLPKLKSVSVTGAIVGRLQLFLETAMKNNCNITSPEGLLPHNFWFR